MRRLSHDEHTRRHHRVLEILQETRNPQTSLQKRQPRTLQPTTMLSLPERSSAHFQADDSTTQLGVRTRSSHMSTPCLQVRDRNFQNDGRFWTGMTECHFTVTDGTARLFNQVLRPLLQRRWTCRNRVHLQPRPRQQELHRPTATQEETSQMKVSRNEIILQAVTARLQRQSWTEGHRCKMHFRDATQKDKNVMSGECFTTVG